MNKPYILLLDPWDYVEDDDSGWGNRIQCWEALSIIIKSAGTNHIIKVLPKHFPELNQVHFPNTEYIELSDVDGVPITNKDILKWDNINKIHLDNNLNYITKYDFNYTTIVNQNFFSASEDQIKEIKLSNSELNKALDELTANVIGIHIRRGNGVHVDQEDLNSIPEQYRKFYRLCIECDEAYDFYRDIEYFNFIDDKIKQNNDIKFYIGIDVEEEAIQYYKKKYPNRILTCNDVIIKLKSIIDKLKFLEPRLQLKTMGYILIDFFTLAKCKEVILSPFSSWSYMGCRITGKHGTEINNLDNIFEKSSKYPIKRRMI